MANFRIFIDSDIIIDLLAKRDHFAAAAGLLSLIEKQRIDGYTTPVVLANVEYIIRKYSNKTKAKRALRALVRTISILPMDHATVQAALESTFPDFEDALQYYAAENGKVDFIITRNKKDYSKGMVTVMTAEEFIDLHGATEEKPEV